MEVHVYGHSMGGHRGHLLAEALLDDRAITSRVKSIDGLFLNSGGLGLRRTHPDRLRHVNTIGDIFLKHVPAIFGAASHSNQLRLLLPGIPMDDQRPVGEGLTHGHESRHCATAIRQFNGDTLYYWNTLRDECNERLKERLAHSH